MKHTQMRIRHLPVGLLILAVIVLTTGCNQAAAPTSSTSTDQAPVIALASGTVVAEGVVEPARWSGLGFDISGEVTEVNIETGQSVQAGDLLARLDTDELELALQNARQDLLAQQAALDLLLEGARQEVIARADKDNADAIAQAEIALRARELQLERAGLDDPGTEVAAAEIRVKQLQAQLAQARAQDPSTEVAAAQVSLERSKIALDDAQDEYNKALDRPWEDQGIRDAWAKQLEQMQLNYRLAQAQLDGALKAQRAHTLSLAVLQAQVEEAQTRLEQARVAEQAYPVTLDTLAADVDAARASLEALRTWENPYRDPAREAEIDQARVGVRKAEIAVEQIALQLEDAELRAPFAGTAADVDVHVGDDVQPGQVLVVLATLEELEVHTTDLTELDVGRITLGNAVEVSVDALPGAKFAGVVSEIALQGQDYRGDVVYEVTVEFVEAGLPESLRWGMTTMVEIETN
jgi:HlyD family secretion protein